MLNRFIIIIFIIGTQFISAQSMDEYRSNMITYSFKERFDQMNPLNIKEFYFYRGTEQITRDQLIEITGDETLIYIDEQIKDTELAGYGTAIGLGVTAVAFLIPSIAFFNTKINVPIFTEPYSITGLATLALTILSIIALIVDVSVTGAILYDLRYNERRIKAVIDRYNETLAAKYQLIPDIGVDANSNLDLSAIMRL